ncbi:MAG: Fic family protein [Nannocystaceae bacterium]
MDSTYVHLRQALALDWSAPPEAARRELRRVPGGRRAPLGVVAAIREDLADEARDAPARADRLVAAAAQVEASARAGEAPTWARLCALQRRVLGVRDDAAIVRSGPAGCADRRYGWWPRLAERLAAKLAADARQPLHPVLQAARLYLDLIHLHPFVDGNARAARLGLLWWLALPGLPAPRLDPLVRLPKPAGAPPWTFVRLIAAGVRVCPERPGLCS